MKSRNREPLICLLFPERSPNGAPDVTHVKIQTDPSECDGLSEQGSPSSVPIGIKNVWGKKKKCVRRKVRPLTKACSLQLIISMKRSRHWCNIVSAGTDMYKSPFSRETSPNRVTC